MRSGDGNTIFALSSAPGRAAVAVIRISGSTAHQALAAMVTKIPPPRMAALRRLFDPDSGAELDQALVLRFDAPASETGEDMVELQVHGGRAVIAAVLATLARRPGLRPAEAGEFVRRAFGNGKLDLTQAEGLADLVDAETEAQRRRALRQAGGILQRLYDGWREELVAAQALVEASIDFADEGDVAGDAYRQGAAIAGRLANQVTHHLKSAHRGEILRDGFRVVIVGPPNAGKSSLLNALARRDVAIVSPEAGTTRDVIEVRLDLGGVPVVLADTAGLRTEATVGAVELEGMRRTRQRANEADLVLWLMDGATPDPNPPVALISADTQCLLVLNKCDLLDPAAGATDAMSVDFEVSAKTGLGLDELVGRLAEVALAATGTGDEALATSARHRAHLAAAVAALEAFRTGSQSEPELRAEDLRTAAQEIGRITGRIDPEDVLDRIFSRFCIGK